ncbi:MAG TPA: DUF1549 domain-containing protein [Pirellulales bacterium]|nr:DUF1549 domain-containing protein [Pirellulales bacterium]
MRFVRLLLWLELVSFAVAGARQVIADEVPPDRPIEEVVDALVDNALAARGVAAAPAADDAAFLRRVTLDLAGRIPTPSEVQSYLAATEPDKKARLVDRLLASPDFVYHVRNEYDVLLMAGKGNGEWRDWLLKRFQEDRRWPELFREVILPREDQVDSKAAAEFLKSRVANVDDMTNDTSRLFFGVSINCAKCHDHPLVPDWAQDHYYGMASFFNRTYLTKKRFLAERDDGELKFRTTAGEEKQARLIFLTSGEIADTGLAGKSDDERRAAEEKQKADNDRETPPQPALYSRRAKLVEVALRPDSAGFFAKAFVNRLWARLFGAGLVTPLDQMHSENPASHPALLAWLARDAEEHHYDLRRLVRGLVLSRAYGRTSRWEESTDRPDERLFALASVKPLTPMQFALSLAIATTNPTEMAQRQENAEQWAGRRRDLENQAQGLAGQIEIPGENFQVSVSEALLFSNGPQIEGDYLRDSADRLVGALKAIGDRPQAIRTAFVAVLSREPQAEEVEWCANYLAARDDRPVAAWQQLVWALVNSSEFRFNH